MAQRRRKRIGGKIVVTVAVFILAGTAIFTGYRMLGKKSPKSDKKNTSSSDKKREIPAINTNVSVRDRIAEKEARKKQNNREDFAVQPGDVPGVQEQTQEKVVYLTLDDGPSPNTQAVLDILDKYQVKATFFVTNGMPEYSYMIKEAYDRGHTIGLHTYSHDYAVVYASQDAYFKRCV